jgi:hypothetical protein
MAAQNEIGAGRLQAVEDSMPMGRLTDPSHIAAATMYFWSNECWCVGEVLTIDGGYTQAQADLWGALRSPVRLSGYCQVMGAELQLRIETRSARPRPHHRIGRRCHR